MNEEKTMQALSKKIKIEIFINTTIANFFIAMPILIAFVVKQFVKFDDTANRIFLYGSLFLGLIIVLNFIGIFYRTAIYRYEVKSDYLSVTEGFFIKSKKIVPIIKILMTNSKQNLIERSLKTASIKVITAGGTVNLCHIDCEKIDELNDYINKKIEEKSVEKILEMNMVDNGE